jgi:hypothetical protein
MQMCGGIRRDELIAVYAAFIWLFSEIAIRRYATLAYLVKRRKRCYGCLHLASTLAAAHERATLLLPQTAIKAALRDAHSLTQLIKIKSRLSAA